MLLAVDGDQRITGANRLARKSLLLDDRGLKAGISLWTIFERDPGLFRRKTQPISPRDCSSPAAATAARRS
jgi:hypothetical protein